MNKKLIIISLAIILFLSGCLSAPYATDKPDNNLNKELSENKDYIIYDSEIWPETVNSVQKSNAHFLDLGTRTQDGSMHIYLQSQSKYQNSELEIKSIKKESRLNDTTGNIDTGLVVKSEVNNNETNNMTNEKIDVHRHIELQEYVQTDIEYVRAEITDDSNKTESLERDACGCVLSEDPKSNS